MNADSSSYIATWSGRRLSFADESLADEPALVDKSTVVLVSEIIDDYARAVFTRLFGGKIARHVAASHRPEGVP